jgi:hypothetical protein
MRRETSRVSFLMCPFCVRALLTSPTTRSFHSQRLWNGDFRRLHRMGLIACHYRAAEWRHKEIELAAHETPAVPRPKDRLTTRRRPAPRCLLRRRRARFEALL